MQLGLLGGFIYLLIYSIYVASPPKPLGCKPPQGKAADKGRAGGGGASWRGGGLFQAMTQGVNMAAFLPAFGTDDSKAGGGTEVRPAARGSLIDRE